MASTQQEKQDESTQQYQEEKTSYEDHRDIEDGLAQTGEATNAPAEQNEFEVTWDGDDHPSNPMNWSNPRKISIIAMLSSVTFLTPLASSMFAPGVPIVMTDFNTFSNLLATFVVSIYVLGFAFDPLVVAPASELLGRSPVYHVCNILFVIFTICNAVAINLPMLIAFRFLAGFAGVGAITIGSGTIADLIPPERRGVAMSLYSMGPIFGPIIGPIAGGFLTQGAGWRWVFWVITIAGGVVTVACFFVLRETVASVILEKKAIRLRQETNNPNWHVRKPVDLPRRQLLMQSIVRPMRILLCTPVASLMSIYIAILYGLLYILFTTFTFVFKDQYNFSTSAAGLSYLGSGVGTLAGLLYASLLSDRKVRQKLAANLKPQPEDRLPLYMVLPGCLSIPVGFFIYGWGAQYQIHWIVPQIGTVVTSFGVIIILMCVQTYLVDTFTTYAASAIAANTVLRSLLGALLPLCGLDIYDALGLGWGNTLFGLIAFGIAPIPILFGLYGGRLRAMKPFVG
ncbi:hypothetical protein PRZ48_013121 [Zasmidium cellare]|uniref:Major facilitator superfamily (MFS) profile domain-containing protein n=1 Tax=Zasmidium cellare TaxID=395010 RepID=A0ABR0E420_ZASCE|nr:hypothetical protein PRZ48_013121 [Zasmidium cellare]